MYDICYFCGKTITNMRDNNNADDWVHKDTIGKRCCGLCNDIIVVPNRMWALNNKGKEKNNGYKSNT